MRLDYTLYVLAVVFFILTAVSFFLMTEQILIIEQNWQYIIMISTIALGILCVIVGYCMRPKVKATTVQELPPTVIPEVVPSASQPEAVVEKPIVSAPQVPATTASEPESELIQIRGINKARADQLKANGITTFKALAGASADDLAAKLEVSPKIMKMWIGSAKKRVK